jgi:hypothetical protein
MLAKGFDIFPSGERFRLMRPLHQNLGDARYSFCAQDDAAVLGMVPASQGQEQEVSIVPERDHRSLF